MSNKYEKIVDDGNLLGFVEDSNGKIFPVAGINNSIYTTIKSTSGSPVFVDVNNDSGDPLYTYNVNPTGSPVNINVVGNEFENPFYTSIVNPTGSPVNVGVVSDSGNPVYTQAITSADNPVYNILVEAPFMRDSFGKVRVSNPRTLFDGSFINERDLGVIFDTLINGSATITSGVSYEKLVVSTTLGDKAVIQSKRYLNYQPGKSLQILMTGIMEISSGVAGVVTRCGYFDDHYDKTVDSGGDGVFYELSGTAMNLVLRSSMDGSIHDERRIAQSSWNYDVMDGSGSPNNPSGIKLDPGSTNIYGFDIEWLGVGSIRCFIFVNGYPYLVHSFHNANLGQKTPYMRKATLPVRWEIENVDGSAATAEMRAICTTVISEGGFNPRGKILAANNGTTSRNVGSGGLPVMSLKLKDLYNRVTVNPLNIEMIASTNSFFIYEVWLNGVLTGPSWVDTGFATSVEADYSATAIDTTNAIKIKSGYFQQRQAGQFTDFENTLLLSSDIVGDSDILTVLVYKPGGGNDSVYAAMQWQEWE